MENERNMKNKKWPKIKNKILFLAKIKQHLQKNKKK